MLKLSVRVGILRSFGGVDCRFIPPPIESEGSLCCADTRGCGPKVDIGRTAKKGPTLALILGRSCAFERRATGPNASVAVIGAG